MRFAFRDLDDYEQWVVDVGGPLAMLVRGLREDEREVLRARLREAFVPFATDSGYRRLAEVKVKYDPENVFHNNKNIQPD